jgi:hypothetical protein
MSFRNTLLNDDFTPVYYKSSSFWTVAKYLFMDSDVAISALSLHCR